MIPFTWRRSIVMDRRMQWRRLPPKSIFKRGGGVCLFTGQRGTGKSTELKRLQQALEKLGAVVFYADLSEFLLLTKEVEISDFLVSVAGALSEKIEEGVGQISSKGSGGQVEMIIFCGT